MKKSQLVSSVFLLFLGVLFCHEALNMMIGRISRPGPGFFPFWLGASMIIVSMALIINCIRTNKNESVTYKSLWTGRKWAKPFFTLVALLLYTFFLEELGYCVSTFILIFFLFYVIGRFKWWVAVIGSTLTSFLSYMLFRVWLEVHLPNGLWSIL